MVIGKFTSKNQITIPKELAKGLNLKAGDYLNFEIEDGKLIIIPVALIPKDQQWYWTDEWQEGEREADEDIKASRVKTFDNVDDLIKELHADD